MSRHTVVLCAEGDLEVGDRRHFDVEGTPICLVRVRNGFRAIYDVCSHDDYPLSAGEVDPDDCLIECWRHGSMFSLVTGAPESFPATQPVPVYPVVVVDGAVNLEMP